MQTVTQVAVPRNAYLAARRGDARALLAIPEARQDIPRLIAGEAPRKRSDWYRASHPDRAADFGNRPAVAGARAIMAERLARREARAIAEAARKGPAPGRWQEKAATRTRPQEVANRLLDGLATKKYAAARVRRELKARPEAIALMAEQSIRWFVALIGKVGDQAEADIAREFGTGVGADRFKAGRGHYFTATNLHTVQLLPDWTAALVTMRDFVSFGKGSDSGRGHTTTRGVSFRCYLVVRDTTTKEAHVLRVPPKFGNGGTKFYGTFKTPAQRVKAAVAWSFSLEPKDYRPAVEA